MSVAPGAYTIVVSYVGFVNNESKYTTTKKKVNKSRNEANCN